MDGRLGCIEELIAALARLCRGCDVNERRLGAGGARLLQRKNAERLAEANARELVTLLQRPTKQDVEKRRRPFVLQKSGLESQRLDRGIRRVDEPLEIILAGRRVAANRRRFRERDVIDERSDKRVVFAEKNFLQ